MKKYDPDSIRNVGIFSHGGKERPPLWRACCSWQVKTADSAGLTRVLLSWISSQRRWRERPTIASSLASFEWNKYKINLLDTPGDDNFVADAKLCMRVVDGAIIVVSAVSGVRVHD